MSPYEISLYTVKHNFHFHVIAMDDTSGHTKARNPTAGCGLDMPVCIGNAMRISVPMLTLRALTPAEPLPCSQRSGALRTRPWS